MSERENISGSRGEYGECLKARQKFNMELYNRCLKDLCKTIERQRTEWDDFQKESAKRKDSPKRNGMPNDNLAEVVPQKNLQESLLFEILEIVKNLEKNFQCLCEHLSKKETFKEELIDMNGKTFKGEVRDMYGKMSSEEFWKNREEVPPILIRKIEAAESKKLHKSLEVFSPKKPEGPSIITQEQRNGDIAKTAQTDARNLQEVNGPLKIIIREDESIKMQEDIIFVPEEISLKAEPEKLMSIRSSKKQYEMKPVTKTESFVERLISGRTSKKISREGSVAEMKIEKTHFERKKTPNLEQFFIHKDAEATTPGGNQGKQNQEQTKPESRQPSEIQEPSKPESRQPSQFQEMSKPESRQPSEIQEMSKPESKQPSEIQEMSKPESKQPSEIQEMSKPESKQPSRASGSVTPKKQENDVHEADKQLSASQAKNDSEKEEVASLEKPNSA